MKIGKYGLMGLIVGLVVCGTLNVAAAPTPPPPPGARLVPGMYWCPRCGGWGRVPSGLFGWREKRCPECKGHGMLPMHRHHHVMPVPPPTPPPPPKGHKGHHHHNGR